MKYAVSVTETAQAKSIETAGKSLLDHLSEYAKSLEKVTTFEYPRGVVFHDLQSATELYSTIPIPAYTSRDLIHIDPRVETWKAIFLSTATHSTAVEYYNNLDTTDVAAIIAHELTHHSEFFHDDFEGDRENMWFEEGMCEYLSKKFMLSEAKFQAIQQAEDQLIDDYKKTYGEYTLDQFGESGYRGSQSEAFSAAFYDYWRSSKTVTRLVQEHFCGDVQALIACYEKWEQNEPLHEYFIRELSMTDDQAKEMWLR